MGTGGRRALTATVAGLLVMAGCTAGGPRPDPPAAVTSAPTLPAASRPPGPPSTRPADRVLGIVWHGDPTTASATLGWLDARSLRERPGRRLALGAHGVGWAVAPDQSLALFAGGGDSNDGRLLVVDPGRLRRLGTIRLSVGRWEWPYASSWIGRSRVLLAGSGAIERPEGSVNATVVTAVDPLARRVVAQRTLAGEPLASGRLPDGLVLLLGPPKGIGPARVAVVDAGAAVHGPVRIAAWLGDGLLAAWGQDESEPVARAQTVEQWLRPAGLQLVDTRTWRATTIHPDASGAVWAGGRLLAFGRLLGPPADPDADGPFQRTYGLTVFGPGDRRPVHLFGTRQVTWLEVSGGRAYVDLTPSAERYAGRDPMATDRVVGVVNLETARVEAEWRGRLPELLVGGCCVEPAAW
jgi:hypothetical protein